MFLDHIPNSSIKIYNFPKSTYIWIIRNLTKNNMNYLHDYKPVTIDILVYQQISIHCLNVVLQLIQQDCHKQKITLSKKIPIHTNILHTIYIQWEFPVLSFNKILNVDIVLIDSKYFLFFYFHLNYYTCIQLLGKSSNIYQTQN